MANDQASSSDSSPRTLLKLGVAIAAVTLVLDHITKFVILEAVATDLAVHSIASVREATLHGGMFWRVPLTDFLNLVLVWNRGVSFGLFSDADARWILAAVALTVAALLALWLRQSETRLLAIGLGLVIGGAVGNVIDRVWHGAVVDFLDVHAYGVHWPAFNVADSAICVGVGLMLLESFVRRPASDTASPSAPD